MTTELVPITTSAPLAPHMPHAPAQRPALVYLASLAPGSQRTMRGALDTIAGLLSNGQTDAEALPWWALRYEHTAALRAALARRYAPATTNKMLAALRGVLLACRRLELMGGDDYTRARDIRSIKGARLPKGRALSSDELRKLLRACADDPGPAGSRDAALIAILARGGLRRSEVVALDLADYRDGALTVRAGKGNKDRLVYLANGARRAVEAWLQRRGSTAGPLLVGIDKAQHISDRRLTAQAVLYVLTERGEQAGLAPFSPHDLRRTFISDLLDAGADLSAAQQLAGHSNPSTTARYDRRGEAAKRRAAGLLSFPQGHR